MLTQEIQAGLCPHVELVEPQPRVLNAHDGQIRARESPGDTKGKERWEAYSKDETLKFTSIGVK